MEGIIRIYLAAFMPGIYCLLKNSKNVKLEIESYNAGETIRTQRMMYLRVLMYLRILARGTRSPHRYSISPYARL